MDAPRRVLPAVAVVAGARPQRARRPGGELGVRAEGLDGQQRLGRRARRRDQDEVRLEGARRQELVDQALSRAQPDAAASSCGPVSEAARAETSIGSGEGEQGGSFGAGENDPIVTGRAHTDHLYRWEEGGRGGP